MCFGVGWGARLPEGLPGSVQISPSLHREYTDTDMQEKLHPVSASGLAEFSWPRLQPVRCSVLVFALTLHLQTARRAVVLGRAWRNVFGCVSS